MSNLSFYRGMAEQKRAELATMSLDLENARAKIVRLEDALKDQETQRLAAIAEIDRLKAELAIYQTAKNDPNAIYADAFLEVAAWLRSLSASTLLKWKDAGKIVCLIRKKLTEHVESGDFSPLEDPTDSQLQESQKEAQIAEELFGLQKAKEAKAMEIALGQVEQQEFKPKKLSDIKKSMLGSKP